MSERQYHRLTKGVSPELFKRRDSLQKLTDEANDDIMSFVRYLNFNGKLVGVDPQKIISIEYRPGTVTITHTVKNWRQFADEEPTSEQVTRFDEEEFFYPEIIKGEPRQLDMDDIESD